MRTILGRYRPIPEITSRNRTRRQQAERLAVNTIIQGSAADLIKVAMVKIHAALKRGEIPGRMLIQVHDELVFEVATDEAERCAELVADGMTTALDLDVPLKVDIATGASWLT